VNYGYVVPGNMTINTNTAFETATSDDFNPSITAANRADTGKTLVTLNWAYTDTPNNVPVRDVYAFGRRTLAHQAGAPFNAGGGITSETSFGAYSSVVPEYDSNGSCAEGTYALVANEYFAPDGSWRTRLARVHPRC
jgi:hypothetical protein